MSDEEETELENLRKSQTAVALIDLYSKTLMAQQDHDIPDIDRHIRKAKQTAHNWLEEVRDSLEGPVQGIIDFNDQFQIYYTAMEQGATDMATGKDAQTKAGGKRALVDALGILIETIGEQESEVAKTRTRFHEFYEELKEDVGHFETDYTSIYAQLEEKNDRVKDMRARLAEERSRTDSAVSSIVRGSIELVIGLGTGLAGAVACKSKLGAPVGVPVLLVGIGFVAAGIAGLVGGVNDLNSANDEIERLLTEIDEEVATVASLENLKATLNVLVDQGSAAVSAARTLETAWQDLATDLRTMMEKLEALDVSLDPIQLFSKVTHLKGYWKKVADQAQYTLDEQKEPVKVEQTEGKPKIPIPEAG